MEQCCIFCGSTQNLTKDHVPPSSIFPKPKPTNRITVPACGDCNAASSKDDEFFRFALSVNWPARASAAARANRQTISRSLQRSAATGLRAAFARRVKPLELRTPGGGLIARVLGYEFNDDDIERLNSVLKRTVRGLFYHHTGRILPPDVELIVLQEQELRESRTREADQIRLGLVAPLMALPPETIGEKVFGYRYRILEQEDDPLGSAWILTFFDRITFLIMTSAPSQDP
jgi:hypothetical protein